MSYTPFMKHPRSIQHVAIDPSCLAAAGQLQAAGDGKQQAETKLRQAEHELAEQAATEQRLRDRLARQEAQSQDRKQVSASSMLFCVLDPAPHALPHMPLQTAVASCFECALAVGHYREMTFGVSQPPECLQKHGQDTVCALAAVSMP